LYRKTQIGKKIQMKSTLSPMSFVSLNRQTQKESGTSREVSVHDVNIAYVVQNAISEESNFRHIIVSRNCQSLRYLLVLGETEMEGVEDGGGDFNELTLMRGFLLEQVDVVPVWGRGT
jgi:hypothetical protein